MGTVILFGLVTLLALVGVIRTIKSKNILGFLFAAGTLAVFGFFTVMTIIKSGYPTIH